MRGKRAKALRQMAMNQWIAVQMKQAEDGQPPLPVSALVRKGPPGSATFNQAINHPGSLRAMQRFIKKSWLMFIRNPNRNPRLAS